jgi:hypothetical protein
MHGQMLVGTRGTRSETKADISVQRLPGNTQRHVPVPGSFCSMRHLRSCDLASAADSLVWVVRAVVGGMVYASVGHAPPSGSLLVPSAKPANRASASSGAERD